MYTCVYHIMYDIYDYISKHSMRAAGRSLCMCSLLTGGVLQAFVFKIELMFPCHICTCIYIFICMSNYISVWPGFGFMGTHYSSIYPLRGGPGSSYHIYGGISFVKL